MESSKEERFAQAFTDVLKTALTRRGSVDVPGLGQFSTEHRSSDFSESPDGSIMLAPPEEGIVFHSHLSLDRHTER
jgi:nucleoid DNA-binding protein